MNSLFFLTCVFRGHSARQRIIGAPIDWGMYDSAQIAIHKFALFCGALLTHSLRWAIQGVNAFLRWMEPKGKSFVPRCER